MEQIMRQNQGQITMKLIKNVMLLTVLLCFFNSLFLFFLRAQQPEVMNGAELKIALEKLQVLGSALYIAAHPDDENTAVLAWLSQEKKVRTGYLSITRGGGGQNLIGSEKGPLMSVLRTYELLEARRIDGAEQFFTRAVDFGYSKTAEESMSIWGKENILEDMVFIIRKFKPDILLTRFPVDESSGHGHHTASAILAGEAFKAAGDPSRFPQQLKDVSTWQPKRILWNTWHPYLEGAKKEETEKLITIDVGTYNPLLGKSYYEIAALSRSMHKSQGFGAVPRRGQWLDYYQLLAGAPAKNDLFEGIDTSWSRVPNSKKLQEILEKANRSFLPHQPHQILPLLLEALSHLRAMPRSYWTIQKTKELHDVIRSCAGLWLEATTKSAEVTPGEVVPVTAAVINRANFPFILKKIVVPGENKVIELNQPLQENKPLLHEFSMKITEKEYTQPYWLKENPQKGIYPAANHRFKGMAVAPYPFNIKVVLEANGQEISFETPLVYQWRDPVQGEKIRSLVVTPPGTVNFTENVFYFPSQKPHPIGMILRSGPTPVSGKLTLHLPPLWKVEPGHVSFIIEEPFTEKKVSVNVTPPGNDTSCHLTAAITVENRTYHLSQVTIQYPHLPALTFFLPAEARLVRVELNRMGKRIGYIMGSGDEIPKYLAQVGYQVDLLSDEALFNQNLAVYDTIITGVRAYNTRDILKHVQKRLLDYVSNGGRLVVQYNVSRSLKIQPIGPYPFELSRERVSEEEAAVTLLEPEHPLFHSPNNIKPFDFDDWVQERGLYFADLWDAKYTPLLSSHDAGEEPQKGGLLFTHYGKGVFIYTGYSFFRQLPAGVPGALKLFVNIIDSSI
jgi:LmbE family N-acetylglucosaminyl deacetylase